MAPVLQLFGKLVEQFVGFGRGNPTLLQQRTEPIEVVVSLEECGAMGKAVHTACPDHGAGIDQLLGAGLDTCVQQGLFRGLERHELSGVNSFERIGGQLVLKKRELEARDERAHSCIGFLSDGAVLGEEAVEVP